MELEGVEVYSQGYYYTANAAVDKSYLQDLYDEASVSSYRQKIFEYVYVRYPNVA